MKAHYIKYLITCIRRDSPDLEISALRFIVKIAVTLKYWLYGV